MAEPITLTIGAVLWAANTLGPEILAGRADRHVLERVMDRCFNRDVQVSLPAAWEKTGKAIFSEYRQLHEFKSASRQSKKEIAEWEEQFTWKGTIPKLFQSIDDATALQAASDVAQLFLTTEDEWPPMVRLKQEWWWEKLPPGLQGLISKRLQVELTCQYINAAAASGAKSGGGTCSETRV